jgi:MAE_28990/MAE_18760-like HEPN
MNLAELRAELEADRAWREEEIRSFQNRGASIDDEKERKRYRRALVLLLYAHYEGFCKFAFVLYASAINRSGILCGEACHAIAAASLADLFRNLRNPQMKSDFFRRQLPDDSKLHRFAREREFVERTSEVKMHPVNIPDHVVDTESNLTPIVLKKNLFRLGLPHDQFQAHDGEINKLLGIRNGISHGSLKDGVEQEQYEKLRTATFTIMSGLGAGIMKALADKAYTQQ